MHPQGHQRQIQQLTPFSSAGRAKPPDATASDGVQPSLSGSEYIGGHGASAPFAAYGTDAVEAIIRRRHSGIRPLGRRPGIQQRTAASGCRVRSQQRAPRNDVSGRFTAPGTQGAAAQKFNVLSLDKYSYLRTFIPIPSLLKGRCRDACSAGRERRLRAWRGTSLCVIGRPWVSVRAHYGALPLTWLDGDRRAARNRQEPSPRKNGPRS
jgi:hypothetical protein